MRHLKEAKVTDPEIARKMMEFSVLSDEIDKLKGQLYDKKERYAEIEDELLPILEELERTGDRTLEVYNIIITIKKRGFDRTDYKYKEAFQWLLERVNQAMKDIVLAAKEETKTITRISSSLGIQKKKLDEDDTYSNLETIQSKNDLIDSSIEKFKRLTSQQTMLERRRVSLNEFKSLVKRIIKEEKENLTKRKVKKVRITESQLRNEVRKMLNSYQKNKTHLKGRF
jgi:hypothetical protein